jgi:hypothetical protein
MPDPEQVEREIVEREIKDTEKVYKKKKKDESAA